MYTTNIYDTLTRNICNHVFGRASVAGTHKWMFSKIGGIPKMDGENTGKPY